MFLFKSVRVLAGEAARSIWNEVWRPVVCCSPWKPVECCGPWFLCWPNEKDDTYQTFIDGKCFYIQSCVSCCWWQKKQYSLSCSLHTETMRYCDSLPLGKVLVYPSSSSVKNSTPQGIADTLNYGTVCLWTHYLLKNPSLNWWEQWMCIYPHSSELRLYSFQSYFSFFGDFRKFLKGSNTSVCSS